MNTKVLLSTAELAIANDLQFILTKQVVIKKVAELFNLQIPSINACLKNSFKNDETIIGQPPKISKGENYNNLPYVILDYPASFSKQHIFAIRTMFWWGNFISITLLVSGMYKLKLEQAIINNIQNPSNTNFFVCIADNPWQHHFEPNNYLHVSQLSLTQIQNLTQSNFIKVAIKYELHQFNLMQQILPLGYKQISRLLIP